MAVALADAKQRGAVGLKIFKMLGLVYRNPDGRLIAIDDPRWDPIWQACGELGLPVLIHTADPVAFFEPIDRFNERWEELHRHPNWSFSGENQYPPQGLWNIYGLNLPDEVLRKVYAENAARLIPGIAERLKKFAQIHTSSKEMPNDP